MLDLRNNVPEGAREILGNLAGLSRELGGTDALARLRVNGSPDLARVKDVSSLQRFLEDYSTEVLFSHELPAVLGACQYTARSQIRELIELDRQLEHVPALQRYAQASQTVGRTQLKRLRPLRSERVVQRYLNAVLAGEAKAWHTTVFGVVLAVYSLPLRQGLTHFALQTLGGFVQSAGQRIAIGDADGERLLSAWSQPVAGAVESLLAPCNTSMQPIG